MITWWKLCAVSCEWTVLLHNCCRAFISLTMRFNHNPTQHRSIHHRSLLQISAHIHTRFCQSRTCTKHNKLHKHLQQRLNDHAVERKPGSVCMTVWDQRWSIDRHVHTHVHTRTQTQHVKYWRKSLCDVFMITTSSSSKSTHTQRNNPNPFKLNLCSLKYVGARLVAGSALFLLQDKNIGMFRHVFEVWSESVSYSTKGNSFQCWNVLQTNTLDHVCIPVILGLTPLHMNSVTASSASVFSVSFRCLSSK